MCQVYDALLRAGRPYTLPGLWSEIPGDPAFFCLPTDRAACLSELRELFGNQELLRCGVAVASEHEEVQWHPELESTQTPLWAIRHQSDGPVSALIVNLKTLGQKTWSFATALADHRQAQRIADSGDFVVVAYSMPDLAILQSLGICAVPGERWDPLDKQQLRTLCAGMGIPASESTRPGETAAPGTITASEPRALILANWSLADLTRDSIPAAVASLRHLANLQEHLDLEFDEFGSWAPSQKRLNTLVYQLRYWSATEIRGRLLSSIEHTSWGLDSGRGQQRPPVKSMTAALQAWRRAQDDSAMSPATRQQAFETMWALVERQRLAPLEQEAMQTENARERNAKLALVDVSRLLQPQMLLLSEKLRRGIAETDSGSIGGVSEEEFARVLKLVDCQIRLLKEIQACRVPQRGPRRQASRSASQKPTPSRGSLSRLPKSAPSSKTA